MTGVSHCMGHALRIAAAPRASWSREVAKLPEACEHGCGGCRARIADYLRMQWRIAERVARRQPSRKGKRA